MFVCAMAAAAPEENNRNVPSFGHRDLEPRLWTCLLELDRGRKDLATWVRCYGLGVLYHLFDEDGACVYCDCRRPR